MYRLLSIPLAANAVLRKIGIFMAFLCGYFDFFLYDVAIFFYKISYCAKVIYFAALNRV